MESLQRLMFRPQSEQIVLLAQRENRVSRSRVGEPALGDSKNVDAIEAHARNGSDRAHDHAESKPPF